VSHSSDVACPVCVRNDLWLWLHLDWSAFEVGVVGWSVVEPVDVGVAGLEVTSKWGVFGSFESGGEDGSVVVVVSCAVSVVLSLGGGRVVWSSEVVSEEVWVEVTILGGVCLVEDVVVMVWVLLNLGWLWVKVSPCVPVASEPCVIEGRVDFLNWLLFMVVLDTLVSDVIMFWVAWSSEVVAEEFWVEVSVLGVVLLVKSVMVMIIAVVAVLIAEIVS